MMTQSKPDTERLKQDLLKFQNTLIEAKVLPKAVETEISKAQIDAIPSLSTQITTDLLSFLKDVYTTFVLASLPQQMSSSVNSQPKLLAGTEDRPLNLQRLTRLVFVAYCKLMSGADQDKEMLPIVSYLLIKILAQEEYATSWQELPGHVISQTKLRLSQREVSTDQVLAALAVCFWPFIIESYDLDKMVGLCNLIQSILKLATLQAAMFNQNLIDFEQTPFGYIFLYLFVLPTFEEYQVSSLLNVSLIVAEKLYFKLESVVKRASKETGGELQLSKFDLPKHQKQTLALLDRLVTQQIGVYLASERYQVEEGQAEPQGATVIRYKSFQKDPPQQASAYLSEKGQRHDWLRTNQTLHKLVQLFFPRFFNASDGFDSPLCRLYDLLRVQLYMILRFDEYQTNLNPADAKKLSDIPSHLSFDCNLVQTFKKISDVIFYHDRQSNMDLNSAILSQIFTTVVMVCRGHFDAFDHKSWLKLYTLLFISDEQLISLPIEGTSIPDIPQGDSATKSPLNDKQIISALLGLISQSEYQEKYLIIFEGLFDLDSISDIRTLQEIVQKIEFGKRQEEEAKDLAIGFVNRAIVQKLVIGYVSHQVVKCPELFNFALRHCEKVIQTNCLFACDATRYVDTTLTYENAETQHLIHFTEYKIQNAGLFNCQLYQWLKLVLGLLSPQSLSGKKAYRILVAPQQDAYHTQEAPDKLFWAFEQVEFNQALDSERLVELLNFLLVICRNIFHTFQVLNTHKPLIDLETLKKLDLASETAAKAQVDQIIKQNQDKHKYMTQKERVQNSAPRLKVFEKAGAWMTRFIIFCSQNKLCNESIVRLMTPHIGKNSWSYTELDKRSYTFQRQSVSINDLQDLEFRLVLMRNILFTIDPQDSAAAQQFKPMQQTLDRIKDEFARVKELHAEFNKLTGKLYPNQRFGSSFRNQRARERSSSNAIQVETDSIQQQRDSFTKYAKIAVSFIREYVLLMQKSGEASIKLLERKSILDPILVQIQSFVENEQSQLSALVEAATMMFCFRSVEETNPLKLDFKTQVSFGLIQNAQPLTNKISVTNERQFDFLLTTVVDYMHLVFMDTQEPLLPQEVDPERLEQLVASMKQMFEQLNANMAVADSERERVTPDLIKLQRSIRPEHISKLKKIYIFLMEHSQRVKETCVPEVIKSLSLFVVRLFGVLPKAQLMRDFFSFFREILYYNKIMDEVDCDLLLETLKVLNSSINFFWKSQVSLNGSPRGPRNQQTDQFMFSEMAPGLLLMNNVECADKVQVFMLFKFNLDTFTQRPSNAPRHARMVLMELQEQVDTDINVEQKCSFTLELMIDFKERTFTVKDPTQKHREKSHNYEPFRPIPVENRWYPLVVRIQRKTSTFSRESELSFEAFVNSFSPDCQVMSGQLKSNPRARLFMSLANTVNFCLRDPNTKQENYTREDAKKDFDRHFRGRCSLPVFLQGLDHASVSALDPKAQSDLIRTLIDRVNKKKLIFTKQRDDSGFFSKQKKTSELQTVDTLTSVVTTTHQLLQKQGYICALHQCRTSSVFVGIGGLKNMAPIIQKVLKSNLRDLGEDKAGRIFSYVFRVLSSLINLEPAHVETLMRSRNLINILKYGIYKIGVSGMITADFLTDLKNIVRNNICVLLEVRHGSRPYPLIKNCSETIQAHQGFFEDFLKQYVHEILLNPSILELKCLPNNVPDSKVVPGNRLVMNEIVEFVYQVCCPKQLPEDSLYKTELASSQKSQHITCYQTLNQIIVSQATIGQLIQLLRLRAFVTFENLDLLDKVGEAIAQCILRLDDKHSLASIVNQVRSGRDGDTHQVTLLVFLKVLLRITRSPNCTQKNIQSVIKNLSEKNFDSILIQFRDIYAFSRQDEILKDQITSVTLLLMTQFYVHNRRQYNKKPLHEKVASLDSDKRKFLNTVSDKITKNKVIHTDTYLTLMQIAFCKQPDPFTAQNEIPTHFDVDMMIKQSQIRKDLKVTDIIDFDVDFYFLVLESYTICSKPTKKIFLQQFGLMTGQLYERFLAVCAGQKTDEQGHNPFNNRLKNFYYRLVQYSPCEICSNRPKQENYMSLHASMKEAYECEEIAVLSEERIVEICVNQFTKSIDDYPSAYYLNETDRWGFQIFRKMIICQEQDPNMQLQTLLKVITKLVKEVNKTTKVMQMSDQVKLILKVILLVQFVEQIYAKNRVHYSQSAEFSQMLMVLMFLCEQLGVLQMDLPDRANQDFDDSPASQSSQPDNLKSAQAQTITKTDLSFGLDDAFTLLKNNTETQTLTSLSKVSQIEQQSSYSIALDVLASCSKTDNFISGGPLRAFLHVLLNMLVKQSSSTKLFLSTVEMLRYLVLRQRQGFFAEVITGLFDHNFSTQPFKVYNLFNRQALVEKFKQKSFKKALETTESELQIKHLLDAERQIIKDTLYGMSKTLDVVLNEETLQAERQGLDKKDMQSKRERDVAERNEKQFSRHQYGATSVDFFMVALILSESFQIVNKMFKDNEKPQELMPFDSTNSVNLDATCAVDTTLVLDNKQRLDNITALLSFTFECVNEHFTANKCLNRNDEIDNTICRRICEQLYYNHKEDWSQIAFLCTFLDSSFVEDLKNMTKESSYSLKVGKPKPKMISQSIDFSDQLIGRKYTQQQAKGNKPGSPQQIHSPQIMKEMPQQPRITRMNSDLRPLEDNLNGIDYVQPLQSLDDRKIWAETIRDKKQFDKNRSGSLSDFASPLIPHMAEEGGKTMILDFFDQVFSNLAALSVVQSDYERSQVIQKLMSTCFKNANNRRVLLNLAKQTSNRLTFELVQVVKTGKHAHKTTRKEAADFVQQHVPAVSIEPLSMSLIDDQIESYEAEFSSQMNSASNVQLDSREGSVRGLPKISVQFPNSSSAVVISTTSAVVLDTSSTVGPERDLPSKNLNTIRTLKFEYARYQFKKIVKRLQEDESSMWYDHVEEQQTEFREIKTIYESIQAMLAEDKSMLNTSKRLDFYNQKLSTLNIEKDSDYRKMERFLNQSFLVENPSQRAYFQSQRRVLDNWGRMMLLKPNRKALDYETWLFYDYFVYFFLNKLFAVSMLNDDKDKLSEIVKPLIGRGLASSVRELQQNLSALKQAQDNSEVPESWENCTTPYSVDIQKFRNEMLSRIDTNNLLKRVLTNQRTSRAKEEDPLLVKKRLQKIREICENEKANKARLFTEAQQIRVRGALFGQVLVTKDFFCFMSSCGKVPQEPHLKYVDQNCLLEKKKLIIAWEQVDEIIKRKLVNIFQGIDIYTHGKKCFTFNFCSEAKADQFLHLAIAFLKDKKEEGTFRIIENPRKALMVKENADFTTVSEWLIGKRSNMELLMLVNKYSGRSFNDLSQYPIFPWIIKDYHSEPLKFQDLFRSSQWQREASPSPDFVFRDLTKHLGSISDEKTKLANLMYQDSQEDPGQEQRTLGYGEFFLKFGISSGQYTSQLLCRLEPYTTSIYHQQDQQRDERLPIEFNNYWKSIQEMKQVCQELLPELFYFPEFYMNLNKLSLGRQPFNDGPITHMSQDAVILPPWAANAHDLVRALREALESKYVSQNLCHWVDMVFGVHNRSVEKKTLYFPAAYDDYWQPERLNYDTASIKDEDNELTELHRQQILSFYTAPSRIFDKSLVREEVAPQNTADAEKKDRNTQQQQDEIKQLIKSFVESTVQKKKLQTLGQIAVHNNFDPSTNIVHMIFNNEKKCVVFVRQPDASNNPETGSILVYLCQETLSKESFREKSFDIKMRYEWVSQDLNNVFQVSSLHGNKLYVCGFLDNSLRVFDLEQKPGNHEVAVLQGQHAARITCVKLSSDNRYLFTCDADGVILHYGLKTKQQQAQDGKKDNAFPYRLLHKLQDQMDEILAIDTNQTLDMYVTFSRDGTLTVRCLRTSKLWYQFKIFSKVEMKKTGQQQKQDVLVIGFSKTFKAIQYLKLSLHGYIVLVGQPENAQKGVSKFLVYNLSGDALLNDGPERYDVKGVFLNANEDQLVIAQNTVLQGQKQGRIRVVKLYSLDKVADLNDLIYRETRSQIRAQKQTQASLAQQSERDRNAQNVPMPTISVIAMKKGETSLNIFFEHQKEENGRKVGPVEKEILCFEMGKLPVWSQLEVMALAPRIGNR